MPIFAELKGYRGDLNALLRQSAPGNVLPAQLDVDGQRYAHTFVLDGVDELPIEFLHQFSDQFRALFEADTTASVLLTARQAFYVANRDKLPPIAAVFHILEFSDADIRQYVMKSGIDPEAFSEAVLSIDAGEDVRNPFVLSVLVEKFRQAGRLSDRRSENLSYVIDRLIQSRPAVSQHRQRRALRMLGVALETYSRNELAQDKCVRLFREATGISDAEARTVVDELYGSILKRTANGLAFQMRSHGEYLGR